MRFFSILFALAAIFLALVWYNNGFQALDPLFVKITVATSLISMFLDGVAASFGYKYKKVPVKY